MLRLCSSCGTPARWSVKTAPLSWTRRPANSSQAWETVYTGACRVKPRSSREAEWGEHEVTLHQYTVGFPWDVEPEFRREDRVTITASDDAWLIGRHLNVIGVSLAGTSTTRRILAEDNEG
ncbi:DUF6093 family protein [Streptosporangium vulgare]|uniref:DUF6093 family protein n=1 Tax=Streptosporangium vulgare TaxID=46190 RepID=UPI0031E22818